MTPEQSAEARAAINDAVEWETYNKPYQVEAKSEPIVVCACRPGDGTVVCPNEAECFAAWQEGRLERPAGWRR